MPELSIEFWIGAILAIILAVAGIGVGIGMDAKTKGEYRFVVGCFSAVAMIVIYGIVEFEVNTGLSPFPRLATVCIACIVVVAPLAESIRWVKARHLRASANSEAGDKPTGATEPKHLVSLRELFENDWPNLPGYYTISTIEASSSIDKQAVFKVMVPWRLNGDFVARSKFLAVFLESTTSVAYARRALGIIADHYGQFIDSANSEVDISGQTPDDTSSTHLRDMVFSKRFFVYYENHDFSLEQKGAIETLYKTKGLSVQFRDAAYAWSHRNNSRIFRTLKPNAILLPDARTVEGLRITVTKLSPDNPMMAAVTPSAGGIAEEIAKRSRPTGPAVDILLTAEKIGVEDTLSHIPQLLFTLNNRGNFDIADIAMRVTEYQLDRREIVPTRVERLPDDKMRVIPGTNEDYVYSFTRHATNSIDITRISSGSESISYDLAAIKPFRFAKHHNPGEPGGAGGPSLGGVPIKESDSARFYALRISFLNIGDNERYATYKIISCEHPYLLPLERPDLGITATGDSGFFTVPYKLIVAHQREMYSSALEIEYPKRSSQ